ncbi:hypothetical protein ALQ35_04259 [Pseudomonas fluorescens]|nr:hypothetical protein ALQ35_04259 [Pseudomonas fluorescens]
MSASSRNLLEGRPNAPVPHFELVVGGRCPFGVCRQPVPGGNDPGPPERRAGYQQPRGAGKLGRRRCSPAGGQHQPAAAEQHRRQTPCRQSLHRAAPSGLGPEPGRTTGETGHQRWPGAVRPVSHRGHAEPATGAFYRHRRRLLDQPVRRQRECHRQRTPEPARRAHQKQPAQLPRRRPPRPADQDHFADRQTTQRTTARHSGLIQRHAPDVVVDQTPGPFVGQSL